MQRSLLLLLSFLFIISLSAQTTDAEEKANEDLDYYSDTKTENYRGERFSDNLWFGGGVQLGFQANNFESFFVLGLSPMVGYKVTQAVSFGPRVSVNYNAYRQRNTGDDFKSNFITWSAGVFGRVKVFQPFFIHAEYSLESDVIGFNPNDGNAPIRRTRNVPYLGAGYSPGIGGPSSEVLILFRLNRGGDFIQDAPFVVRAGFNFNF